jgi:hypothetical protein
MVKKQSGKTALRAPTEGWSGEGKGEGGWPQKVYALTPCPSPKGRGEWIAKLQFIIIRQKSRIVSRRLLGMVGGNNL